MKKGSRLEGLYRIELKEYIPINIRFFLCLPIRRREYIGEECKPFQCIP